MLGSFASALTIINVDTNNCSKDDSGLKNCYDAIAGSHRRMRTMIVTKHKNHLLSFYNCKTFFQHTGALEACRGSVQRCTVILHPGNYRIRCPQHVSRKSSAQIEFPAVCVYCPLYCLCKYSCTVPVSGQRLVSLPGLDV